PTRGEAVYLEGILRSLLLTADEDPRGFSLFDLDIVTRMTEIERAHHALGLTDYLVMDGLRQFLVANVKGARCSDSATEPMAVTSFNAAMKRFDADWVVPFIDTALKPSKLLPPAHLDLYWQTAEASRLYGDFMELRGPGKKPYPESVRQTYEWRRQAERLVL